MRVWMRWQCEIDAEVVRTRATARTKRAKQKSKYTLEPNLVAFARNRKKRVDETKDLMRARLLASILVSVAHCRRRVVSRYPTGIENVCARLPLIDFIFWTERTCSHPLIQCIEIGLTTVDCSACYWSKVRKCEIRIFEWISARRIRKD